LAALIQELGAHLERVVIDKVVKNTFHAKLQLRTPTGEKKIIDARPSDSVALAVRLDAPLFVSEDIIEKSIQIKP